MRRPISHFRRPQPARPLDGYRCATCAWLLILANAGLAWARGSADLVNLDLLLAATAIAGAGIVFADARRHVPLALLGVTLAVCVVQSIRCISVVL